MLRGGSSAARTYAGRHEVRSLVAASLILALGLARPARADERLDETAEAAPPREPVPGERSGVPTSWIIVGGGVLLVFAAIPLIVQADMRVRREEGAALGLENASCDASPTVCRTLAASDTDAIPYWVGAGVVAGLGVATITTGAILHWKYPSMRGNPVIGLEPRPGGATASIKLRY